MAYNSNIPQPTDRLKISQADLLANFQEIDTLISANHGTFGTASQGKHKFLQMPEQTGVITTAAFEAGLYSKVGVTSTTTEAVFKRENNGVEIFFTEGSLNTTASESGWARFANGSLVKWGLTSSAPAAANTAGIPTYTVTFPVAANIPVFATVPIVFTENTNATTPGAGYIPSLLFTRTGTGQTTTGFDISKAVTGAPITIRFLAIGT